MEVLNSEKNLISRYIEAQERDYETALKEVRNGRKQTHWIWYIFPQISGLGSSWHAKYYGIKDRQEAKVYLEHEILGKRLREISNVLLEIQGKSAVEIFGDLDAMKVKSCMTLFDLVSPNEIFALVLAKYYESTRCRYTIESSKSYK